MSVGGQVRLRVGGACFDNTSCNLDTFTTSITWLSLDADSDVLVFCFVNEEVNFGNRLLKLVVSAVASKISMGSSSSVIVNTVENLEASENIVLRLGIPFLCAEGDAGWAVLKVPVVSS